MPIRNMGTLLENIVLVEMMRFMARWTQARRPLDILNSFAMPPLSGCCAHRTDYGFSASQMNALKARPQPSPSDTYEAMLWSCLQQPAGQPGTLGPNGALLCSILAHHLKCPVRLWLNDIPDGHYGNALPGLAGINAVVQRVLGLTTPSENIVVVCADPWPNCLRTNLSHTLAEWKSDASARLGFLDPMRYRIEGGASGETDSASHREWLRLLSAGTACPVVSVHFTGHNNWPTLRSEISEMHSDGCANGYDHTLVARHSYYHTVCNIRAPQGPKASGELARDLKRALEAAWRGWFRTIDRTPDDLEIRVM